MPAIDRYTGVLFDALDARSLSAASRRWLGEHVWIHSAPLGPVGALDALPTYRLAAGTSLPGLPALRGHWAEATSAAIAEADPSFVLDLRSEAYVALGPVPSAVSSAYVRVVTAHGRALNHFNKKSKGLLVRAIAEDRPRVSSLRGLRAWAQKRGSSSATAHSRAFWSWSSRSESSSVRGETLRPRTAATRTGRTAKETCGETPRHASVFSA